MEKIKIGITSVRIHGYAFLCDSATGKLWESTSDQELGMSTNLTHRTILISHFKNSLRYTLCRAFYASTHRPESKQSILYGLGTTWCVCPKNIWKYLGDESDDEAVTRRKCISLIMGVILALLLLAIIIGLIIGLGKCNTFFLK